MEEYMNRLQDYALYDISWNLSPEHAVTMYLEWGNNDWRAEHPPVRSKDDFAHYFVLDNWTDHPTLRLVMRNSENAEDLFTMPLPHHLLSEYESVHGKWRGISEPTPAIKSWLRHELGQ